MWIPIRTASRTPWSWTSCGIARPHRRQQLQASPHGALGIVLMRLRIAEVDEQAIAQVLGDMALVALDDSRCGLLVGAHHRAEVFGVELPGEACGVGQVTEQHRELAAFGVGGGVG